jgi:acetyl esterase/lipase
MKTFILFIFLTGAVLAAPQYPPELPGTKIETYKKASGVQLKVWIYNPDGHQASDKKPAVVFFFGGGWKSGSPGQFAHQCRYLASRGIVAMTADYRVSSRQGTKAVSCVEDGKSAVRWIRKNAGRLGVDPTRVGAGGGSAGGHVAAAIGIIREFDAKGEDKKVSSTPDALLLFNPAVTLADIDDQYTFPKEKAVTMGDRAGVKPVKLSPYHHVRKNLPPTIIFHGTNDSAVDHRTVVLFEKAMREKGNRCELVSFKDKPHGFFNYGKFGNEPFRESMLATDKFLSSLDWLKGNPSIDQYLKNQ